MKLTKFLFLFFLFIGLVGTAQAAVSFSQIGGTSGLTSATYDLPSLYSAMVTRYNESYVQSSVMNETSPKHWEFRSALNVPAGMTFYINNSTCEELHIGRNKDNLSLNGFIKLNNISVIGWNFNESRPYDFTENGGKNILYNESHDCYFANMDLINYGYQMGYAIQNLSFSNITCQYFSNGINWQKSENVTVDGITVIDGDRISGGALNYCYANNSTFSNIYTDNITTLHKDWNAGSFGIHVVGSGNTIRDFSVNVSGWTGVAIGNKYGDGYNYIYNGTILYAGHNGLESSGDNQTVENVTIKWSGAGNKGVLHTFHQSFYVPGDLSTIVKAKNITYRNITLENDPFTIGQFVENFTVYDSTIKNISTGIEVFSSENVKIINCTYDNCTGSIAINDDNRFLNTTNNTTIIDNTKIGAQLSQVNHFRANDTKLINTDIFFATQSDIFLRGSIYNLYYMDIKYINNTGFPLSGIVTIENQEENNTVTSSDGLGTEKSTFSVNGRTSLPSNRTNSITVQDARYTAPILNVTYYNYTINASSDSGHVILDNINPDSRWHRTNPLISKYTITAIQNNSDGLHFLGYAPTPGYNNFSSGDSVKFQIWGSEPLTNVVWKKDNVTVQSGTSTTYETVLDAAPITVDITGETATETISRSFVVDPNQIIDPDPEPEDPEDPETIRYLPVSNFTSDVTTGAIPLKVNFTDTSTNATSWYWDFDNNGVIDSTVRNATFTYKTKGNYTVKLTTSNADGMNISTQINYIQVQGRTGIILHIWNWFSNIFTFLTGVAING